MRASLQEVKTLGACSRVVWLQTGFLGDIILTTAAFEWIRRWYPSIRQSLITTPLGAKALEGHPALDEILVFDKRKESLWRSAQNLRKACRSYDQATTVLLQTHRSARSSLLAKALGFYTVTYTETSLGFLAQRRVPRIALLHETLRIKLLLEGLGVARCDLCESQPSLPRFSSSTLAHEVRTWAEGEQIIAIAPGSVWGTKRWPSESFGELAAGILSKTSAKIVVLGSADEKEAAQKLALLGEQYPSRLKNLVGLIQLSDLRAIYPQLSLLVCNDSSPLHYASAFGVPSLALFGATVPALGFGPLSAKSQVIEVDLPCRPCSDHGPQTCPLSHFSCMRQIGSERVLTEVLKLLG